MPHKQHGLTKQSSNSSSDIEPKIAHARKSNVNTGKPGIPPIPESAHPQPKSSGKSRLVLPKATTKDTHAEGSSSTEHVAASPKSKLRLPRATAMEPHPSERLTAPKSKLRLPKTNTKEPPSRESCAAPKSKPQLPKASTTDSDSDENSTISEIATKAFSDLPIRVRSTEAQAPRIGAVTPFPQRGKSSEISELPGDYIRSKPFRSNLFSIY